MRPQVPQILHNGDAVSIGSTQLAYEVMNNSGVPPTVYAAPGSSGVPPTVYGSSDLASNFGTPITSYGSPDLASSPGYPLPSSAAPPPPMGNYNIDPYASPTPKKKSRRGLWIILSVVVVLLVIGIVFATRGPSTTPTQTFQAYCAAIKAKDAQTAHGLLSTNAQQQVPEASLKKEADITSNCAVSSVDNNAGTGVITYTLINGGNLLEDDKVTQDNNTWKIDYQKVRSTPNLTLIQYCNGLSAGDFQTAYNQFSSAIQSKTNESQFASSFGTGKPTVCTVNKVDDTTNIGLVTMTFTSGQLSYDEKLINENGAWKIDSEQQHSTPTVALNNYCAALKQGDFQTAYNQFSSAYQSKQSESDFAASFSGGKPSDCTVSNVDDNAGKGTVTMTFQGTPIGYDETLANENGAWKINTEQQQK